MSRSLYISAIEAGSGKSLISLGLAELLMRRVQRLGFFRPVVRTGAQDNDTELIRQRYCAGLDYTTMHAVTHEEARELYVTDQYDELLKRILASYKALEKECDFVLCEGTDYTGLSSAFELDFNARLANHLGCPVLVVASGVGKSRSNILDSIRTAREGFDNEGCTIAAVIVNRVPPLMIDYLRHRVEAEWKLPEPVYVLQEHESLARPTIGEIRDTLHAKFLLGSEASLNREALDIKIAAMHLPNFLEHIREGTLVITPGDRGDVLLASLATVHSENYAPIAGVLLTGGIEPADSIVRLIDGLKNVDVPVLLVNDDTLDTAGKVMSIRAAISPRNERKIAAALGVFEAGVNAEELERRIDLARPTVVTPLMFEYQLIERAKIERQHIVLPEGEDDRILRAAEILLRREVAEITLLGNPTTIEEVASSLGLNLASARIIDPRQSEWQEEFGDKYFELRATQGRDRGKGPRDDARRQLFRHHDGLPGTCRRDGLRCGAHDGTHHSTRPGIHSHTTQLLDRFQCFLYVLAHPCAGVR